MFVKFGTEVYAFANLQLRSVSVCLFVCLFVCCNFEPHFHSAQGNNCGT